MAGIQIGSSFQLTSPQPHLANASFPDAPTRLAQGQLRHVSWRYSQDSPDAHYRIKPLAICFLADGVTPAVQFDSWGTLEAHWRIAPVTSDDLPESATPTNRYYTLPRAALKADLVNGVVPASQLPPASTGTAPVQATNAALGTVRGGGTGNVNINADGSMTATAAATAAAFASITGAPADNANLNAALNARFNNRGTWAASTLYQPNDVIFNSGAVYYNAGAAFTSGTTFLASNWTAFANLYASTGIATNGAMTQAATTAAITAVPVRLMGGRDSLTAGAAGNNVDIATLESAVVGGNNNRVLGPSHDSGIIGGASITVNTPLGTAGTNGVEAAALGGAVGAVGGLLNNVTSALSAAIGGLNNTIGGYAGAIIAGARLTLPVGAWRSAIVGGQGFAAPAQPDTLFTPQVYLFSLGGGVSLLSPDGNTRALLTISNTGQLLLNGTAIGSAAAAPSPTVSGASFTAA